MSSWHFITGQYPPERGGVGDYTEAVAQVIADSGAEAHVWCRGDSTHCSLVLGGVRVHRIAGSFGRTGLARLSEGLDRLRPPRTILIQYVPHAFGWRAMNLAFAAWAWHRARLGDDVRVMFHEVAYPWVARPLRHNVLAAANRVMAAILIRASSRVYVSIPGWIPMLRRLGAGRVPITWTPIPSNVPSDPSPSAVERRRAELTGDGRATSIIGHFGTYSASIAKSLTPIFREILTRKPDARVLLLGAGGERFGPELVGGRDDWRDRVVSPGALPSAAIAESLRACDLVIQPYPDGVSSRRTTVMAALANGVPVATTIGHLTEPIWADGAVAAVPVREAGELAALAIALIDTPDRLAELGRAGRRLYEDRFAIGHTIAALLDCSPTGCGRDL